MGFEDAPGACRRYNQPVRVIFSGWPVRGELRGERLRNLHPSVRTPFGPDRNRATRSPSKGDVQIAAMAYQLLPSKPHHCQALPPCPKFLPPRSAAV